MLILQILIIIVVALFVSGVIAIIWSALITEDEGTVGGDTLGGVAEFIFNAGVRFIILWILITAGLMWIFL